MDDSLLLVFRYFGVHIFFINFILQRFKIVINSDLRVSDDSFHIINMSEAILDLLMDTLTLRVNIWPNPFRNRNLCRQFRCHFPLSLNISSRLNNVDVSFLDNKPSTQWFFLQIVAGQNVCSSLKWRAKYLGSSWNWEETRSVRLWIHDIASFGMRDNSIRVFEDARKSISIPWSQMIL